MRIENTQILNEERDQKETAAAFQAIERGNNTSVREFIRNHLQGVNATDSTGNTLLNVAAQYGCYKSCQMLINNGSSINSRNLLGNTPLHYANAFQNLKILNLLIESGADEHVTNLKKLKPWEGI